VAAKLLIVNREELSPTFIGLAFIIFPNISRLPMSSNSKKGIDGIRESEIYDYSTLMEDNRIGRTSELFMVLSSSARSYRDRNYIIKDIISKLAEHGELNKSNLISYCGLNAKKHEYIIDDLESNGFIIKNELFHRKRTNTVYKPTEKGLEFYRSILQSYEKMFPRKKTASTVKNRNK
jgi:predicted transcriptional regulator